MGASPGSEDRSYIRRDGSCQLAHLCHILLTAHAVSLGFPTPCGLLREFQTCIIVYQNRLALASPIGCRTVSASHPLAALPARGVGIRGLADLKLAALANGVWRGIVVVERLARDNPVDLYGGCQPIQST